MLQKNLRKASCLLLILLFCLFKSQVYSLDQLENITEKYRTEGNIKGIVDFNKDALKQYQKVDNKEGIVAANVNIANYLMVLNRYKESLPYIDHAEKEVAHVDDVEVRSKFYGLYARNYFELGLYDQALENFDTSVQFSKKITDKARRKKRLYIGYTWKMACFEKLGLRDSMEKMERRILSISPEPLLYCTIALRNLDEKKPDSAKYYLDKASAIVDRFSAYEKAKVQLEYGRLYTYKKDYEKALPYYLQAIAIFDKMKSKFDRRETYKHISETYTSLHDDDKAEDYLKKYSQVNDSIILEEKKIINYPVKKIIQEKEKHEKKEKNKLYILIAVVITGFLVAGYFIAKKYLKKQKDQEDAIIEKSLETTQLKRKVNSSFDEVIHLAKTGDQLFLTRFNEVYSDFHDKLISLYPDLTPNEMRFCALLHLNFSAKEIMQFENVTLRTIETRKYRLRKKLGLASNIDLNKLMMEL